MTSGVFERIASIFEAVCDLPEPQRAQRLDDLCLGDDRIRRAVLAMLEADERTGGFLDTPALGGRIDLTPINELAGAASVREPTPERIGPFAIRGVLGQGGMGVVYRAQQTTPTRDIALKVIAPGLVTAATLRRFELEIQTLARLHHPGIAQVYDAGVVESAGLARPWFAMELVEGPRIDEHCRERKLPTNDRLRLFLRVCDAVEHAHVKGVVHRDLKPANVLIDATGQPKVLDFGVARALDADPGATLRTETGQIVGTIAYMSPEQIRSDHAHIDTRSDVYSLGVILFEMLTGALPHDVRKTSIAEAARRICADPPRRLAEASRAYKGDLDTIVRTALEPDVSRRYQSAGALAQEIRRFLDGQPIVAHPPSAAYTLRKFASRHRATAAALLVAAAALLAGAVVSTALAVRATRAERIAERERDLARVESARASAVNEFLNDMLASADPDVALGRDLTINEVLDDAVQRLEGAFERQPEIEARVRRTIAGAYRNLGRPDIARANLDRSIELLQAAGETGSEDYIYARAGRALTIFDEGDANTAVPELRTALADAERALGPEHDATLRARNNLGLALATLHRLDEAEQELHAVRDIRLRTDGPDDAETLRAEFNLLRVWMDQGRLDDARRLFADVDARAQRALPERHTLQPARLAVAAWIAAEQGDAQQARDLRRQALDLATDVLGESHPTTLRLTGNLAWDTMIAGDAQAALPLAQRAYEGLLAGAGESSAETLDAMNTYAAALSRTGDLERSEALNRRQLDIALDTLGPTHRITLDAQTNLGVHSFRKGDFADAEVRFRIVYDARRAAQGDDSRATNDALQNLASAVQRRPPTIEDPAQRVQYIEQVFPIILRAHADNPLRTVTTREQLIGALHDAGRHADAAAQGRELVAILESGAPPNHERVIVGRSLYSRCLAETGDTEAARAQLQQALASALITFGADDPRTSELRDRLAAL